MCINWCRQLLSYQIKEMSRNEELLDASQESEWYYVPGTGEKLVRLRTIASPVPGTFTPNWAASGIICAATKPTAEYHYVDILQRMQKTTDRSLTTICCFLHPL